LKKSVDEKVKKLTVASLFAGVGGICQAFKNADFDVVWANEIDNNACKTYNLNHKGTHLFSKSIEDLTKDEITNFGKINILTAGFPCQPFSLAGHRKGFEDPRGKLFFNFIEILNWLEPDVYLLENVKNIVNHDNGKTIKVIEKNILNAGYSFIPLVLKASDYSTIPQARERTYIIGFKGEANYKNIQNSLTAIFGEPKLIKELDPFSNFLEHNTVEKNDYYSLDNLINARVRECVTKPNTFYQYRRYYVRENKSHMCPTLTANMGGGGHNVPIILDQDGPRRLTPKECFNFQGFPKQFKLPKDVNKSQLYKQAGNAVVVPVVEAIAKQIKKVLESNNVNANRSKTEY